MASSKSERQAVYGTLEHLFEQRMEYRVRMKKFIYNPSMCRMQNAECRTVIWYVQKETSACSVSAGTSVVMMLVLKSAAVQRTACAHCRSMRAQGKRCSALSVCVCALTVWSTVLRKRTLVQLGLAARQVATRETR